MQDHPGAPGSARQGNTGTDVPAACGGAAAQSPAPGHSRPRATPMPMPKAPDHNRSRAVPMPQALGHTRSRAASMAPSGHAGRGPASAGPCVPMTTAPWPACVSRLLQEVLLRVAATPYTLIHTQSRQNTAKNRTANSQTSTDRRSRSVTYPVHPALLVPTRPPPATAGTGFPRQRHSRAPPLAARRKPTLLSSLPRSQSREGINRPPA